MEIDMHHEIGREYRYMGGKTRDRVPEFVVYNPPRTFLGLEVRVYIVMVLSMAVGTALAFI